MGTLRWREDAPSDLVLLAVGKRLADMDQATSGEWRELALLTGTTEQVEGHGRLLRALSFRDDDYAGAVYQVVPHLLGDLTQNPMYFGPKDVMTRFPKLMEVSDYLQLPDWIARNEPRLAAQVLVNEEADALLPDGTVLSDVEAAAGRLGVAEMRRQVDRIRRDYNGDAEALIGHVKELVESTCKTILGLTGDGPETRDDVPALVHKTLTHLGLHPKDVQASGADPTEANAIKKLFGGFNSILTGAAELRNRRGGGHGRSGAPVADDSVARLTAGMVLAAVLFLCEAYEERISAASETGLGEEGPRLSERQVRVGSVVNHPTYGIGTIVTMAGSGDSFNATVRFNQHDEKRLLMRHAPLALVRL
ncbi:abortive infection family protein [Kribbella sp. DT2]|uniref:abortive infection family protein n=1 Tax=Kribbella sp. DT2 TaxID=3393427 RepID=UPI003CF456D1